MKQTSFITLIILFFILVLTACQENEWVDWKLKNEQWLETNKNAEGIITTESGLQYKVINQGWEYYRKPNKNSTVKVKYSGSLIDGTVFDSSDDAILSLSTVISGWREGIPKMNEGGIYKLYIPSSLGYNTKSTNSGIPPNSTLIFDIELLESEY